MNVFVVNAKKEGLVTQAANTRCCTDPDVLCLKCFEQAKGKLASNQSSRPSYFASKESLTSQTKSRPLSPPNTIQSSNGQDSSQRKTPVLPVPPTLNGEPSKTRFSVGNGLGKATPGPLVPPTINWKKNCGDLANG